MTDDNGLQPEEDGPSLEEALFDGAEKIQNLTAGDQRKKPLGELDEIAVDHPNLERPFDPNESNLVKHAIRELDLAAIPSKDKLFLMDMVINFAKQNFGGGEGSWFIVTLVKLLQFENLTTLTDDSKEWQHQVKLEEGGGEDLWQSIRNPEAFSRDGGKSFYLLSENDDPQNPTTIHFSTNHLYKG